MDALLPIRQQRPEPAGKGIKVETRTGECDGIGTGATGEGALSGMSQAPSSRWLEWHKQEIGDSTILASWVQRRVDRPVLRALDGNGLQRWSTAPSFDRIS